MFENYSTVGSVKVTLSIPTESNWHDYGIIVSRWCKENKIAHLWCNDEMIGSTCVAFWLDPDAESTSLFMLKYGGTLNGR